MGRPKKVKGDTRSISCAMCGKESSIGYHVTLTIHEAEVTPDFFISYDTDIFDYDSFFCSLECFINFIKEEIYVRGNESQKARGGASS